MLDWIKIVLFAIVIMALMYISASCAPGSDPSVVNRPASAYVGKYVDMEHNNVCYFTYTSPQVLVCIDEDR